MTYINIINVAKASLILLALLIFQSMTAAGLSSTNMNATCTYNAREAIDKNNIVFDVRLIASSKLPSPQTLKVSVIGENGVVLVEIVKPLARVYCSFKGDKLVLMVGNAQNEYNIKVLGNQTITIYPKTKRTTVVNVDVRTENAIDYALSSLRLIDALLYGYPVSLRGRLLSISCFSGHNVSVFQVFYNGTVKDQLDAYIQIHHNILLYHYSGPPLPSLKELLDVLKERCKGTIESTISAENWSKVSHINAEEPLLPLPAGLAIFLDNVLPVLPPEALSPTNTSAKPTFTTPELVKAVKQAYKRLVNIVKSLGGNIPSLERQATTTLKERQNTRTTAPETTPTTPSNAHQNNIDTSLLLFPLALAIVAYMVWREHKI